MRISCLVNNFNYGCYVREAVESVLQQTTRVDEIIVVDDGSTDESLGLLRQMAARDSRIRLIEKANGGQLSTFNAGYAAVTGDVVFFLDADDAFQPNYVERMLRVYRAQPDVGFAFCGREVFGKQQLIDLSYPTDCDLGYTVGAVALAQQWFGAPTSCISMRRDVLLKVLPLPDLEMFWTICADVCLVNGASLAAARKYYVAEPLVRYRAHEGNRFYGKPEDAAARYRRRLYTAALIEHYVKRFCYEPRDLEQMLHVEFRTIPRPTLTQLKRYLRFIAASRGRLAYRSLQLASVVQHYWNTRRKPRAECARPERHPVLTKPAKHAA